MFIFLFRIVENGVETVITEVNGVVTSKTVNGMPQNGPGNQAPSAGAPGANPGFARQQG